ncbi:hypothetical protein J6590_085639 [Homalodisca vitripennis]|nr:hypothetical protein J6590_085639 [Homalodisca vitripennis]
MPIASSLEEVEVEVGSQKCSETDYATYCDGPLESGTAYELRIRAFTATGYRDSQSIKFQTGQLNLTEYPTAFGIVILIVLAIAITSAGSFIVWRRCSDNKKYTIKKKPKLKITEISDLCESLTIEQFLQYTENVLSSPGLLMAEFNTLENENIQYPQGNDCSEVLEVQKKDDETRVILEGHHENDYINASHVMLQEAKSVNYIACQAPKANSCGDFWKMIFQFRVKIIVMLCTQAELEKTKGFIYYPRPREVVMYDDIVIACRKEEEFSSYIVRHIVADKTYEYEVKKYSHLREIHGLPVQNSHCVSRGLVRMPFGEMCYFLWHFCVNFPFVVCWKYNQDNLLQSTGAESTKLSCYHAVVIQSRQFVAVDCRLVLKVQNFPGIMRWKYNQDNLLQSTGAESPKLSRYHALEIQSRQFVAVDCRLVLKVKLSRIMKTTNNHAESPKLSRYHALKYNQDNLLSRLVLKVQNFPGIMLEIQSRQFVAVDCRLVLKVQNFPGIMRWKYNQDNLLQSTGAESPKLSRYHVLEIQSRQFVAVDCRLVLKVQNFPGIMRWKYNQDNLLQSTGAESPKLSRRLVLNVQNFPGIMRWKYNQDNLLQSTGAESPKLSRRLVLKVQNFPGIMRWKYNQDNLLQSTGAESPKLSRRLVLKVQNFPGIMRWKYNQDNLLQSTGAESPKLSRQLVLKVQNFPGIMCWKYNQDNVLQSTGAESPKLSRYHVLEIQSRQFVAVDWC